MTASTTSRSTNPHFIDTFKPSLWRYLAYQVLAMFAAYQVAYVLLNLIYPEMIAGFAIPASTWLFYSLVFTLVYALALALMSRRMVNDYLISITKDSIEGPSGDKRGRIRFTIGELDREKTRQTGWRNSIFQYRHIWSMDGKRIVLFTSAFNSLQINNLLEKIGCGD
jgi:hypothetical protein